MTSLVEELLELSAKVGESRYLVELLLVYANGFKSIFFFSVLVNVYQHLQFFAYLMMLLCYFLYFFRPFYNF